MYMDGGELSAKMGGSPQLLVLIQIFQFSSVYLRSFVFLFSGFSVSLESLDAKQRNWYIFSLQSGKNPLPFRFAPKMNGAP
jgi:hypothetical protein